MLQALNPKNATVLVVEDSPEDRQIVTRALDRFGVRHIVTAPTAEDALTLLAGRQCDIALVDCRLPGMDGLHLLERLREQWPEMRVIVVTGSRDAQVAVEALKLGASDYVVKDELLTSGIVRGLQNALRTQRDEAQHERDALLQGGAASLDLARGEVDWILETLPSGNEERGERRHTILDVDARRASARVPDEEAVTGVTELIRASFAAFPDAATTAEQALIRRILYQGMGPHEFLRAYRASLDRLRLDGVEPLFTPALCLVRVLALLVEHYQAEQTMSALERVS